MKQLQNSSRRKIALLTSLATVLLLLSFTSSEKSAVLYRSLNPTSISSHLAFYQLFSETPEGKMALNDAWKLLSPNFTPSFPLSMIPQNAIDSLVALVTKAEGASTLSLPSESLHVIEKLSERLPNRKLKGHTATSEEAVLQLAPEEIDLSKGLLLAQSSEHPELKEKLHAYEAMIDLMALQILVRLPLNASPQEKIREMNRLIFEEMGYRFPPHSSYAKDIDLYTYLPSVIDSRRGVCLGVSILYLALSQRINLPLEAITPPGHIYIRYHTPEMTRNIETTARGIHVKTEEYLGIENDSLPLRNMKEVIGLAYFNEASLHWQNENYNDALKCYQKTLLYLPEDPLVQEFMGYNLLFVGEIEKGRNLLSEVYSAHPPETALQRTLLEDYLENRADEEAIRSIFIHVDEKRDSLLRKQKKLEEVLKKWPSFHAGYHSLGVTLLQLHRNKEALAALNQYIHLEPNDPTTRLLLAELNAVRSNYPAAWEHLHHAKSLLNKKTLPKALKHFQRQLAIHSPE